MKSFRQIVLVSLVSLASVSAVYAQGNATTYSEALKACGADWRASEARKAVAKGEGAKAWQEFRTKCVKEKGWQGKKTRNQTAELMGRKRPKLVG
jgi:hypothetical protein